MLFFDCYTVLPQQLPMFGDWLLIDVETTTDKWRNDVHQQYFELANGSEFVSECMSYLPDPIKQARLDIPRMDVILNGEKVQSVNELLHNVAVHQVPIVAALCTQVIFGTPYERAAKWVPSGMFVSEHSPSHRAFVYLLSKDQCPPFTINSVYAQKRMQAGHPCLSGKGRTVTVDLEVDVDISTWEYAVICVNHYPRHRCA